MSETTRQKIAFLSVLLLFLGLSFGGQIAPFQNYIGQSISVAHADDDDDEDEGEEREDGNDSSTTETVSTQKAVKVKPVYKTVFIDKISITLDPIFRTDTDKDLIVDGLDPHPIIPEKEFFTDDDNDGVANAFDMHKDEDDFAYYEQENDTNGNGILDSYEVVAID